MANAPDKAPSAPRAGPVAPPRSDVLIVDDDPPIRNLLRQIFRRMGFDAREARDGVEAISHVEEGMPRLIMLDLMMPRMNGWEVLWCSQRSARNALRG